MQIEDEQRQKDEIREQFNQSERRHQQLQQERAELKAQWDAVCEVSLLNTRTWRKCRRSASVDRRSSMRRRLVTPPTSCSNRVLDYR